MKNIQIELLQDRNYGGTIPNGVAIGGNILLNTGFTGSASDWDLTTQTAGGTAVWNYWNNTIRKYDLTVASYFSQSIDTCQGCNYRVSVEFTDYNRVGNFFIVGASSTGSNVTILSNTIVTANSAGTTGNGYRTIDVDFIKGGNVYDKIWFGASSGTRLRITKITLKRLGVDDSLVIGRLEAPNPEDFSFAMTFAINDTSDIESRMGSYSKTFEIPATAHNNKVLKHMNIPNSTNLGAELKFKIPCRISFGNLYSIYGLIQIQDVIRVNNSAIAYSCVFYGDNVGWASLFENKYLHEMVIPNSTNLPLTAKAITETWNADNAATITKYDGTTSTNTSPVIYPVATYGPTNETGVSNTFQLLRQYWEYDWATNGTGYSTSQNGCYGAAGTTTYGTPEPVVDWRPMMWVYKIIKQMFEDIGFSISSNFIESDNFKRLLFALPNCEYSNSSERYQNNLNQSNFLKINLTDYLTPILRTWSFTQNFTWTTIPNPAEKFASRQTAAIGPLGSHVLFNNFQESNITTTDASNYTYFTIGTAGYYRFEASNFSYYIGGITAFGGTGQNSSQAFFAAGLGIQCQTVGHSGWQTLDYNVGDYTVSIAKGNSAPFFPFPSANSAQGDDMEDFAYEGYFNEGDKIRLLWRIEMKLKGASPVQGNTTYLSNVYMYLVCASPDVLSFPLGNADATINIEMLNPSRLEYQQNYNLTDLIPQDYKQLDFLKGISHCFNLQFQTDTRRRTVTIEPYTDFYLPPKNAIDWTGKLDRSKEIRDEWIQSNFTRRLIFKYKSDDKDVMSKYMGVNHFENINDFYPYWEDLSDGYPTGETIFENPFFAGTYENYVDTFNVTGTQNFYAAALWEYFDGQIEKGYDFLPRLLYYTKLDLGTQEAANTVDRYINENIYRNFKAQWWEGTMNVKKNYSAYISWSDWTDSHYSTGFPPAPWYGANPPYKPFGFNWYHAFVPQCTFINRQEYRNRFGLSYGNYVCQDYYQDGTLIPGAPWQTSQYYGTEQTGEGLYHRYYKPMIDGLIQQPKMRRCYVDLTVKDIAALDFSKLVYIDGIYYKLIKVSDWMPAEGNTTLVELHQYNPAKGAGLPQTPVWINTTSIGGGNTTTTWGPGEEPSNPNLGF